MKSLFSTLKIKKCAFAFLVAQVLFASGCTSVLWDKKTFAHRYEPAAPNNLRLFYSMKREDILVEYDELSETDNRTRPRRYWLEPNMKRANPEGKPHFVSVEEDKGLIPVAIMEAPPPAAPVDSKKPYAVAGHNDNFFTLYLGNEPLDPYQLPRYMGASQRVKQVVLTPFAAGVDATVTCAVACYFALPSVFSGLGTVNR